MLRSASPSDSPPLLVEELTFRQVSEFTGLDRAAIRYRIRTGRFPAPLKIDGRAPVFARRDIEAYLARRAREQQ